ncbi:DUF3857 domain-containing protein [bacterium]|nr:DUF3857 domain-containing protein [candidate division CSSED10-310 bacterium]
MSGCMRDCLRGCLKHMAGPLMVLILLTAAVLPPAMAAHADGEMMKRLAEAGGPAEHPLANLLIVLMDTEVAYQADGSFTVKEHQLVKVLNDQGRKEMAEMVIPYNRRYNDVKVNVARIINSDGSIVDVPEEAITDGTMEIVQQMNIYEENFRQKKVIFPELDVGDACEVVTTTDSRALCENNFNYLYPLQYPMPVKMLRVRIDGPDTLPIAYFVSNGDATPRVETGAGRIINTWLLEDVPMIQVETGMVSFLDVAKVLLVNTFKDWRELSRFGASLNDGKLEPTQAIVDKVKELTEGLTSEREKINAIYHFVSTQIRYMGSSMDLGAFLEPHEVGYTFDKQYGVCRDKSILMMSMLRLIGVKAEDTLVSVSRKTVPELPSMLFEHAIVRVFLEDGSDIYMDPTLELSAAFGEPYVHGRYVLPLTKEGSDLLLVPDPSAARSMGHIVAVTEVLGDGSLQSNVKITGSGFYDFILRTIGKQLPGFQLAMFWQTRVQNIIAGAALQSPMAGSPVDLATPYEISFGYVTPPALTDAGAYRLMKIPMATLQLDFIMANKIEYLTGLKRREYPIFLFTPHGTEQEEIITIPPGYRIKAVPDSFSYDEGAVHMTLTTAADDSTISFKSSFTLDAIRLSPEDYLHFREAVARLNRFQKSMVILEPETQEVNQ